MSTQRNLVEHTIGLTEHFDRFVAEKAEDGRFGSEGEVFHAALRLLEEREMRLERLRRAIEEGENSGQAVPFDFDDLFDDMEAYAAR